MAKRERRIKPDAETSEIIADDLSTPKVATEKLTGETDLVQPVAPTHWKPPFSADGVKVLDKEGRVCALCSNHMPWNVRLGMAQAIAASLNQTVN